MSADGVKPLTELAFTKSLRQSVYHGVCTFPYNALGTSTDHDLFVSCLAKWFMKDDPRDAAQM